MNDPHSRRTDFDADPPIDLMGDSIHPEPASPEDLDRALASAEVRDIERRLLEAHELEIAEALADLDASEADSSDGDATSAFVASVKAGWLAELRQTKPEPPGAEHGLQAVRPHGTTALLPPASMRHPAPETRSAAGKPWGERTGARPDRFLPGWPLAAAAAAVLALSWFGFRDTLGDGPAYLGPANSAGDVPLRGPSTRPEVLPETVDFSGEVPEHVTFRIEIHDVTKDKRLDDVVAFEGTTYEPRWTCSEARRATLPTVMRFEVHREVEPPNAAPMWSRVYARQ